MAVDAKGLHELSCRKSSPCQIRVAQLNDIVWRVVTNAQYPAVKEPVGLSRSDDKRPDGVTLIPWTRGKPVAWDVTVPDSYANSYIADPATTASAAENRAADNKTAKYQELAKTHQFAPLAIETGGAWNEKEFEFISKVGIRITEVTNEQQETMFLFQTSSCHGTTRRRLAPRTTNHRSWSEDDKRNYQSRHRPQTWHHTL